MAELVGRLDAWLARNRADYYARLRPGLSHAAWLDFESQLGVKLPDAFRVLYQWRDGQGDTFDSFHGNRQWMPAEDIGRVKTLMDGMIGYDFEPGWWDPNWVPFLENGAGSYLCVDVAGPEPGRLVEFWNRDHDRPEIAPSLEWWTYKFVTSLERDRWERTKVGFECVEARDGE
ncbi:SMI1 / KNR4 family protein [Gemmata obscuriglobus]|uniref:SMI1/KNR4 family protein n=2 Tax=Gemmata obscuriglobus TaxID=114 RepID=A0A2Z3H4P0_9BACT|nr:SMI1/KNR4 family protein [Gemmata obscuriglobus]QEG25709.1 SMI1 / KNR4 family protein [Gemmata obscuriglobus]VTR99405.1 Protein involved in beta-1 3-glucan synthesis OS=Chitinophaga pinensis (strain ATCC 43595 / DSM 2588 / NCIB 11800 / UQM 2034) GN=Cpin_5545 PE=4 SV=1: SMI1_KNR4 [Gemmata obscuriglobus UQM 2246]